MGEFLKFNWPLNGSTLLLTAWGIILIWLILTQLVLRLRRTARQRISQILERAAAAYGPISVFVTGAGEAVAAGSTHLHWIDCQIPAISFSLPLSDVTHLKVIDEDPDLMKLSFRLSSELETRVLCTQDILQATELFRLMQSEAKMVDYLAR